MRAVVGAYVLLHLVLSGQGLEHRFTVWAFSGGGMATIKSCLVQIEPDGTLVVDVADKPRRTSRLAEESRQGLLETLKGNRVFDLKDRYGTLEVDGPRCYLKITLGDDEMEVALSPFQEGTPTPEWRDEKMRALRVWAKIKEIAGIADLEDGCSP